MCTLSLVTALSGSTENYLLFAETHLNIKVFVSLRYLVLPSLCVLLVFEKQTPVYLMLLILILGMLWLKLALFVNVRCIVILVNKPTWCAVFHVCLFLFSTCFGQPCAHHQENYCINMTSGLCHCLVCRLPCIPDGHLHTVTSTRWRNDKINAADDGYMAGRNM
jgi:hypothetical protein